MFIPFNRFELEMPEAAVDDCSHSGSCDNDVEYWADQLSLNIDPEDLRTELKEYGAWDAEELSDHEANIQRIIWIAAGIAKEDPELCR